MTSLLEYTLGISSEDGVTIVSKVIQDMSEFSVVEDQHVKKPDFAGDYVFTFQQETRNGGKRTPPMFIQFWIELHTPWRKRSFYSLWDYIALATRRLLQSYVSQSVHRSRMPEDMQKHFEKHNMPRDDIDTLHMLALLYPSNSVGQFEYKIFKRISMETHYSSNTTNVLHSRKL